MGLDGRLAQANARLKAGKVGVRIELSGNRLCLRATLPPKPGSLKTQPYQQRLFIGVHANAQGLSVAEQRAKEVGVLLDQGKFDWGMYVNSGDENNVQTVGDWVIQFERDYFTRRSRSPKTETTWQDDYVKVFKTLPQSEPLTAELMIKAIEGTTPDTRTRKRFCVALGLLADFAGVEVNIKPLKGRYSTQTVEVREVPDDQTIALWIDRIPNPAWRWAYGMMATYGLRNHELFYLDFAKMPVLTVGDGSKTNWHRVWPIYPEWVDQWRLADPIVPKCSGKNNTALGNRVTHAFDRYKIPFNPYDLRHAWAVRSIVFGLPVELAAQQMGHSVDVHCRTYHRWISEEVHDRAYRLLMERSDRPTAPTVTDISIGLHDSN